MKNEIVAQRLIALRGERTQEEVAKAVGITQTSVNDYEQGNRVPNDAVKLKIAGYFGVCVEKIFFEE